MGFSAQWRATRAALAHVWVPLHRGYLRKQEIRNPICVPSISSKEYLSISAKMAMFFVCLFVSFIAKDRNLAKAQLKRKNYLQDPSPHQNFLRCQDLSSVPMLCQGRGSSNHNTRTKFALENHRGYTDRETWICIWDLPFHGVRLKSAGSQHWNEERSKEIPGIISREESTRDWEA